MKTLIAVILALLIGAACRWFEIPVPAPPRLSGALLILAVTLGYVLTDTWISRRGPLNSPQRVSSDGRVPGSFRQD